ncbi:hypothetical protein WDV06_14980 [Streptomyces racemochromogenes]|uniref:DUF3618 domain-containing protein n=1 Tax=Streptomyces racemochromogenes TaxID=67353 RepID=A0ABW7PDG4_9ACTN
MTASEKSDQAKTGTARSRSSSRGSSSGGGTAPVRAADAGEAVSGTLTALPAPLAEKTQAAATALRGSLGALGPLWKAVRARKAVAAAAATGTAALAAGAYTLGHRTGLRRRGPISRLTGGRI